MFSGQSLVGEWPQQAVAVAEVLREAAGELEENVDGVVVQLGRLETTLAMLMRLESMVPC
jgi:hypothetical protein